MAKFDEVHGVRLRPCVYKIVCLKNGKYYVGSTVDFLNGMNRHISKLSTGKHYNKFLQRDWTKYGYNMFSFICMETFPSEETARMREMELVKKELRDKIYNGYLSVSSGRNGLSWTYRKFGEEPPFCGIHVRLSKSDMHAVNNFIKKNKQTTRKFIIGLIKKHLENCK